MEAEMAGKLYPCRMDKEKDDPCIRYLPFEEFAENSEINPEVVKIADKNRSKVIDFFKAKEMLEKKKMARKIKYKIITS